MVNKVKAVLYSLLGAAVVSIGSSLFYSKGEPKNIPSSFESQIERAIMEEFPKVFDASVGINTFPRMAYQRAEAGKHADIFVFASTSSELLGIEKVVLYEDEKPLKEQEGNGRDKVQFSVPVDHLEQGQHVYSAETIYFLRGVEMSERLATSESVVVEFSGKEKDLPPYLRTYYYPSSPDVTLYGNKGSIFRVTASDYGDNYGLEKVEVHLDAVVIKVFDEDDFEIGKLLPFKTLDRRDVVYLSGYVGDGKEHRAYAVAYDKGGNKTKSKEWVIK